MQTKDLVSTLRRFDAYPKTLEDFRVKTFGGAAGKLEGKVFVLKWSLLAQFGKGRSEI